MPDARVRRRACLSLDKERRAGFREAVRGAIVPVAERRSMYVLVVDDSVRVRQRLVEMVSALPGVDHVDTAARAAEALQKIAERPPDVMTLDLQMPGGGGLDVLAAIRAEGRSIVTIVLTNYSTDPYRTMCLRAGAQFFFDKSTQVQHAIDLVERLAGAKER